MIEILSGKYALLFYNNLVVVYLFSYMHRSFYKKNEWAQEHKWLVRLFYFFLSFAFLGMNMLGILWVNMFANVLAFLIPLFLFYKVDSIRGILYFAFSCVLCTGLEFLTAYKYGEMFLRAKNVISYEHMNFGTVVILNLLEIVAFQILCYLGNRNTPEDRVTVLFCIVPVSSVLMIIIESERYIRLPADYYNPDQYWTFMVVLFIANVLFFFLLEKYTQSLKRTREHIENEIKLKAESDYIEMAADSMKKRLAVSEEMVKRDREMRHDRRHFEAMLYSLLLEGNSEKAMECLEERLAQEPKSQVSYCDNITVNAILTHYVSVAEKNKIKVEVSTNIPKDFGGDEVALAIAVSNLLENAINACMELPEEERLIKVTARYKKQLLLEVANPCKEKAELDKDGHPVSHKEGHGIGTRSVLAFVNKTDSRIKYIAEDNSFKVRMIVN